MQTDDRYTRWLTETADRLEQEADLDDSPRHGPDSFYYALVNASKADDKRERARQYRAEAAERRRQQYAKRRTTR